MTKSNLGKRLDCLSRWGIALIFLGAGLPKAIDTKSFAGIISAYGLVPDDLVFPAAVIVPLVEIVIAACLLWNRPRAMQAAALMLLLFISVLGYGIFIGLDIDCGCFGPEDPEHSAFSGLRTALSRDVLMGIPVVFSIWYSQKKRSIQQSGDEE
jgi:hypothetical protein